MTPSGCPWSTWWKNEWLVSDQPGWTPAGTTPLTLTTDSWGERPVGLVSHHPPALGLLGCSQVQVTQPALPGSHVGVSGCPEVSTKETRAIKCRNSHGCFRVMFLTLVYNNICILTWHVCKMLNGAFHRLILITELGLTSSKVRKKDRADINFWW